MGTLLVLLVVSCLVIAVVGSRGQWQRQPCPACRSYNPAGATRCAYCTSWLAQEVPPA